MLKKLILSVILCAAPLACASIPMDERRPFGVLYTVWVKPEQQRAVVKIRLKDNPQWVRWLQVFIDPERHSRLLSSGELSVEGDSVKWYPPAEDAWLQYDVDLISERDQGKYDGYVAPTWALFRADDLVPPIRSRLVAGVKSRAKLHFNLPRGWSVTTRYPRYSSGRFEVNDPHRLFDRPTGWLVMGHIGTRRERIGDTRVAVSGPVNQGLRRMDILAMLNWTVPVMQEIFPGFPDRLLIVSAGDPMWRGALSGPNSLYIHSDRPMISGNGTSTLIHELIHVAMSARSGPKADWIVEGLAEYYSLEVLRRSGTISEERFEKAHRKLAEWGEEAGELEVKHSTGPVTAKAVARMRRTDQRIREQSGGAHSLDDVARALARDGQPVTRERFYALVEEAARSGDGGSETSPAE